MVPDLQERDDPIDSHLEAALSAAEDDEVLYHLREALQLRLGERGLESPQR